MSVVNNQSQLFHPASGKFKLRLRDLATRHPNISFGPEVPEEYINSLGYFVVQQVDKPTGDVVTELTPVCTTEGYWQVYESRSFTEQEIANNLKQKIEEAKDKNKRFFTETMEAGYPYEYEGDPYRIQINVNDIANLNMVADKAKDMINSGDETLIKIRTKDNSFIKLSPIDVVDLVEKCRDYVIDLRSKLWQEEDRLSNIKSIELIDVNNNVFL